ncbi:MAG TPA: M1 family metallopeptidase [Chitinophagaceae bacterium]|nr:M1 family metallopeptidase [Chitinophagaceae bacterium]
MSKSFFSLIAALSISFAAFPQYWQQQVNYTIDVTLNDKEHSLDGFEKIIYTNNSPDTIDFIWFHLWPNAYKNDKTAFSEQLLINNRTDFYFSRKEQRGYINRLDFKVNGITAQTADHPQYIDIIKLLLPKPLLPGGQVAINTPFHVQLPENFSRGGHTGQAYQVTQWFPKPAVYDSKGWHPFPYLDQGEFYSEFGNYDVRITLPENYVVAATGELQDEPEKEWLKKRAFFTWEAVTSKTIVKKGSYKHVKKTVQTYPLSAAKNKTIQFIQNNVHDFAWFADKRFVVQQDTIQLASGRIITAYSYYLPAMETPWKKAVGFIKNAVHFRSSLMGEYPYNTVSVAETKMGFNGGMEYPTITSISPVGSAAELEGTIEHEVGHNWLQGIVASNERQYPWMDEGMNTYYDNRYQSLTKKTVLNKNKFLQQRIPQNPEPLLLQSLIAVKKDRPINTAAENFTELNYGLVAYYKTGEWMKLLENYLGKPVFDSCMREYYRRWQFKHPNPEDFKAVVTQVSGKNTDDIFNLHEKKGDLLPPVKRAIKPVAFFNFTNTGKYSYINILPAAGYNQYDKFMIGLLVHNYNLPAEKFQFLAAPMYATGSKTLNGLGRISYTSYPSPAINKIVYSLSAEKFSANSTLDTFGNKVYENFSKIVPGVRVYFNHPVLSKITSSVDLRGFFIKEKSFDEFAEKTGDSVYQYPTVFSSSNRWVAQLSYDYKNNRALYPYQYQLQWQQGEHFYRLNLNGNYFFNYAKAGGLNMRVFAAKFGYIGTRSIDAYRYQPKLLGVRGEEDYTYSNYFLGRSASIANNGPVENKGLGAQQIMIRDGGFKLILDQYDYLQGRSENWVAAMNFTSTLPASVFPEKFPLKLFLDIGTYAEAWKSDALTSRFLYTAGLQLSLLKNVVNVYMPILYSNDFKNEIKSTWPKNKLLKTISFSIDIQNFSLKKLNNNLDF